MQEFAGKVAVVMGGGGVLGAAMARRFAREGMAVALADADVDALAATREELLERGARVIAVETDISSGESVEALAARVMDELGGVHVLVNNVGINTRDVSVWTTSERDWEWAIGANLWGMIHALRSFVPIMLESGEEGHIVNTASTAGLAGRPGTGSYVVTKSAVLALSEVLWHELKRDEAAVSVSVLIPHIRGAVTRTRRPEEFVNPGHEDQAELDMERYHVRLAVSQSRTDYPTADEIAGHVIDSIREDRFYIISRPDIGHAIARARAEAIVDGRAPATAGMEYHQRHETDAPSQG